MRYNPFNPQQPARPDFFVGRTEEVEQFEEFLSQTMHGSPMNMAITGNRGIGKTSILFKFEDIAKNAGCLTLRLSNYEGNLKDIGELVDYIILNLKREILAQQPMVERMSKFGEWIKSLQPIFAYKGVSLTIERKKIVGEKILHDNLNKIWENTKQDYSAIVLLIDEAEALENIEGALPFLRDVFQRLSATANYMVVLCGKLNFKERMAESFSPLNRFFPTTELFELKDKEIREYVNKKLKSVNVEITNQVLNELAKTSEGHPYVVVSMCYTIFKSLGDGNKITEEVFKRALPLIKGRLEQDYFISLFHPLTPRGKKTLLEIAKNLDKLDFTFKEAVSFFDLEGNQVSPYIQELWRKGCINKPKRGHYEIFHTLFLNFLKEKAKVEDEAPHIQTKLCT